MAEQASAETKNALEVRAEELAFIDAVRNRQGRASIPPCDPNNVDQVALQNNLIGLAFSGGGIRSATFNLGILRAFACSGFLSHVDYLSTVSGGGYIGG